MKRMEHLGTTPAGAATAPPLAPTTSRRGHGVALVLVAAILVGGSGGAAAGYAVSRTAGGPVAAPVVAVPAAQPVRSVTAPGGDGVVGVVNAVLPAVVRAVVTQILATQQEAPAVL